MTEKRTQLYPLHLKLGAKMVSFAGYQMPLHYPTGIIHEHRHTRELAGFFDISHMGQLCISGPSVAHALEKMTPSNIGGLPSGRQLYTVFTNNQGGIIDDLIISHLDEKYYMIVNAARREQDLHHLQQNLAAHCFIENLEHLALFAIQGPAAAKIITRYCDAAAELSFMHACHCEINGIPCLLSRSGYTGEDGFEISVENASAEKLAKLLLATDSVQAVGLGARDTLRLEAGLCLYGQELSETITPIESGLDWIINKKHHHYPGAEIISRQIQTHPDIIRVGLKAEGRIPVRAGVEIFNAAGRIIGHVSSGSFGPSVGYPVAMGVIEYKQAVTKQPVYATIRKQTITLTIVPLPFVAHRYYRK